MADINEIKNEINTELSDLYYDHADALDALAFSLDIHTFEELIDNYALRLDAYNFDEIQKQICVIYENGFNSQDAEALVKLLIDSTFFE